MKKRCIIIGSGLGGLSCGVLLAKNGYDVTVLEQNARIGGCLQCFTRCGTKFETGMHFIGSCDEGQVLHRLLRYLEVMDDLSLDRLDPAGYDVISLQGSQFRFANGREAFIEELAAQFPAERDRLASYFDLVSQIAASSTLHALQGGSTDSFLHTEYQLRSINEVLEQLIADPLLRNVLVGNLPLYAAELEHTPFAMHAFIFDFYNRSAFRIGGGSDTIADSLAGTLQRYGGRIVTRQKAERIHCDDVQARSVETQTGDRYDADLVISSVHPRRTLEMLSTKLIRPAFRNRIHAMRNTAAGFSVYLRFRENTVPYMNSNFYGYRGTTPWGCENYTDATWPKGYLYMHMSPEPGLQYARSGVLISYMSIDELAPWFGTAIGHRGEDYEAFKYQKAQQLLNVVEQDFPGLRQQLDAFYTSTPLTYQDYTGTEGGSLYGIARSVQAGAGGHVSHKTRIPNLLLTGQNINSHGILGVLIGTLITCSELLGAQVIHRQIEQANQ